MSISSVGSGASAQPPRPTAEASEIQKGGRDHDGDSDDGGAQAVKSTPTTTVNTTGQKIGQILSTAA